LLSSLFWLHPHPLRYSQLSYTEMYQLHNEKKTQRKDDSKTAWSYFYVIIFSLRAVGSVGLLDSDIVLGIVAPKPLPTASKSPKKGGPQRSSGNCESANLPTYQKRQFADLRFADPIFFAICGFVILRTHFLAEIKLKCPLAVLRRGSFCKFYSMLSNPDINPL
jgi:hypothetical protein